MQTEFYKDLCNQIVELQLILRDLYRDRRYLYKEIQLNSPKGIQAYDTEQIPSGGRRIPRDPSVLFSQLALVEGYIKLYQQKLKKKKESRRKIDQVLSKLEGVDYQVVYLRDIEGLRLGDIADKLNFSEVYVKKISSRNPKEYTRSILTKSK